MDKKTELKINQEVRLRYRRQALSYESEVEKRLGSRPNGSGAFQTGIFKILHRQFDGRPLRIFAWSIGISRKVYKVTAPLRKLR